MSLESPAILRGQGVIYSAFLMPGYKIISFPRCWNLELYCERAEFLTAGCSSILSNQSGKTVIHTRVMSNHWVETSRFHTNTGAGRLPVFGRVAWEVLSGTVRPQMFSRTLSTKDFLVINTKLLQNVPLWLSHVQWYLEVLLPVPWSAGYKDTARGKLVRNRETSQEEMTTVWWESACE